MCFLKQKPTDEITISGLFSETASERFAFFVIKIWMWKKKDFYAREIPRVNEIWITKAEYIEETALLNYLCKIIHFQDNKTTTGLLCEESMLDYVQVTPGDAKTNTEHNN